MIRLIDPVTFVVPGTAGARVPVVVEKFGAELRPNFTTASAAVKIFEKILESKMIKFLNKNGIITTS